MGKAFFPLDEELELLPGHLAPRQQEHLAHLACFMPFGKVAEMMEVLLGVVTNEETVRRLTEEAGSWMEAAQTAEVEASEESEQDLERPLERCVFSADGAMISLVYKQWAETRTVAIGEPQERVNTSGEREIHVGKLSYFSRLADASTFTRLAEVEIRRRRVREATSVAAVMDGADWCQTFTDKHRPDAVRILDFPHAAEHITGLLEALENAGGHFPPKTLERSLHILKHRGPRPLLRMADRIETSIVERKGVQEHLEYLRKREALMQYRKFRDSGWPIGSGMVESANKNIVEARLKGTGMHWQRKNVNPMLTLRNAICNNRWREMWQKAVLQHRRQQALQRSVRPRQRAKALLAGSLATSAQSPPQSAAASKSLSSPAPSQPRAEAESPPVISPPPEAYARQAGSSRPSSRRKQHTARNRITYSHQKESSMSPEVCSCGMPLEQLKGRKTRRYCSNRCRQHAYRKRQTSMSPPPLPVPMTTLPNTSRPFAQNPWKREACCDTKQENSSSQESGGVKGETCLCGTPLMQSIGGRIREYCSDRCRQRAYRQRQKWVS